MKPFMKMSIFLGMTSSVLIAFEGLLPLAAQANDWFYLTTADDNSFHVFFDPASIYRRDNVAHMKSMFTNQQADEYGAVASIHSEEYDCEKKQYRFLQVTFLYENRSVWQSGENLPPEWQPIPPESISDTLLEAACDLT
jgi:hypothetical protein